jgi:hypothetical protein
LIFTRDSGGRPSHVKAETSVVSRQAWQVSFAKEMTTGNFQRLPLVPEMDEQRFHVSPPALERAAGIDGRGPKQFDRHVASFGNLLAGMNGAEVGLGLLFGR